MRHTHRRTGDGIGRRTGAQGVWKPDVLFELQQAVDAYDFYRQQMAKCDEQLKQHMALLPARRVETLVSSAEPSPTDMSKKSRSRKPQGNEPAFDLGAELERILSVNATTIDGINVMTVQTVLAEVGPDLSAWKLKPTGLPGWVSPFRTAGLSSKWITA